MRDPTEALGGDEGPEPTISPLPPPLRPYDVGYKRPPESSQFKKGVSGNPKGRPRGSRSIASLMRKYGNKTQRVTYNGRSRLMTNDELIVAMLHALAQKGNGTARRMWIKYQTLIDAVEAPETQTGGVIRLPSSEFAEYNALLEQERKK